MSDPPILHPETQKSVFLDIFGFIDCFLIVALPPHPLLLLLLRLSFFGVSLRNGGVPERCQPLETIIINIAENRNYRNTCMDYV